MTFDLKEQITGLVEVSRQVDEWDQIPMLFVYQADPDGVKDFVATIMGLGFEGDPVVGLHAMVNAIQRGGRPPLPASTPILGMVLQNEGWGLRSEDIPHEEIEAWIAAGKRYVDHPAAVETKIFTGVRNLGSGPVIKVEILNTMYTRHEEADAPIVATTEGRIPDVLRALFVAMTEAMA